MTTDYEELLEYFASKVIGEVDCSATFVSNGLLLIINLPGIRKSFYEKVMSLETERRMPAWRAQITQVSNTTAQLRLRLKAKDTRELLVNSRGVDLKTRYGDKFYDTVKRMPRGVRMAYRQKHLKA